MSTTRFIESLESRVLMSASPSLLVQGQNVTIPRGDATISMNDFTDFGPMSTSSGASRRQYVIKNTGTAPLTISSLKIVGTDPADFTITKSPTGAIAPGAQGVFIVKFQPQAEGARSAKVVLVSNDPTPRYSFAISGEGLNMTTLADGLQYATTVAGSGIPVAAGYGVKVDYTGFLLNGVVFDSSLNPGRTPLYVQIVGGTDPTKMHVIQGWDEGLQGMLPGEHRTLIIPSSLGYGATGSAPSIPPNATLVFEVTLLGYPYLRVRGQDNTMIPSGSTTLSASAGTEFGTTTKGQTVTRQFLLKTDDASNSGLGLYTINFSGTQSGQFTWSASPYDSVLGGWPLTITYKAGKIGTANVTVSIPNGDPNHVNYTFLIHGQTTA